MKYNDIKILTKVDTGSEPVSLATAKAHLFITGTDHDTYLPNVIKASRIEIEGIYNVSLVDKTITAEVRNEIEGIELPYGATTITSLVDVNGDDIDYTDLKLDTLFCYGLIEYDTTAVVREDLNHKILERVAYKFANRGDAERPAHKGSWII